MEEYLSKSLHQDLNIFLFKIEIRAPGIRLGSREAI